jgi:hypothetical protein
MDLQQIIAQAGGVEAIAGQLGISPQQASSGIGALLPAVLGGFKKTAQEQPEGLGGLLGMVQGLGGGGLVDNVLGSQPTEVGAGNNILGQIFGSKDVSRTVAAHAASQSGLDSGVLQKLLPIVAMLGAGYMAKQAGSGQGGGLGDLVGGMLGGGGGQAGGGGLGSVLGGMLGGGGQSGGLGGLLGGLLGGGQPAATAAAPASGGLGGIGAMLDMNGDGNPLDDILGMAGKLTGR